MNPADMNRTVATLDEQRSFRDTLAAETARRVLDLDRTYGSAVLIPELRTAAPELARALIESQAALAALTDERDDLKAQRDAMRADVPVDERLLGHLAMTGIAKSHDAYKAQKRAEAERDEARAALAAANARADLAYEEKALADREFVASQKIVRELVDGLATAKDSMLDGAAAVQRLILLHGSSAKAETLAARMRTRAVEIESLLAKHAAPAPTPAAVPGLVFGEPGTDGFRQARASDGQVYTVDRMALARRGWFWCWIDGEPHVDEGYVDTESEAIAAASAHNAARLKGGE